MPGQIVVAAGHQSMESVAGTYSQRSDKEVNRNIKTRSWCLREHTPAGVVRRDAIPNRPLRDREEMRRDVDWERTGPANEGSRQGTTHSSQGEDHQIGWGHTSRSSTRRADAQVSRASLHLQETLLLRNKYATHTWHPYAAGQRAR